MLVNEVINVTPNVDESDRLSMNAKNLVVVVLNGLLILIGEEH
jgi:hypothetical protein